MDEVIISPNLENAVTITLMAFVGFAVIGLITRAIVRARMAHDA